MYWYVHVLLFCSPFDIYTPGFFFFSFLNNLAITNYCRLEHKYFFVLFKFPIKLMCKKNPKHHLALRRENIDDVHH